MDVKKALKEPEVYLSSVSTNNDDPTLAEQLHAYSRLYSEQKSALKQHSEQKREIASQFKHHKNDADKTAQLKAQMQAISTDVKTVEAQLKQIQDDTEQLLSTPQTPQAKPIQPLQFIAPATAFDADFSIEEFADITNEKWIGFLASQPEGQHLYHSPPVYNAIENGLGHSSSLLLALSEGNVIGGLVLVTVSSPIFGDNIVSTPFFNYGGPATPYTNVAAALIEHAGSIGRRASKESNKNIQVEIRTTIENLPFASSSKKVSMVKALPSSVEQLNRDLGTKVRAQVNKATPNAPQFVTGGLELLDDFYAVFATNMRDLGTPVYGKNWFRALLTESGLTTSLALVYVCNKPVACGFLMGFADTLEIPWASTIKAANKMNINMWMYHQTLEYAVTKGYSFFDFGRSTKDAPTFRFKKQWGAQPVNHYWYYPCAQDEQIETANPDNPKFKILIAVWKRLPVWLANMIGPPIIKGIP